MISRTNGDCHQHMINFFLTFIYFLSFLLRRCERGTILTHTCLFRHERGIQSNLYGLKIRKLSRLCCRRVLYPSGALISVVVIGRSIPFGVFHVIQHVVNSSENDAKVAAT